MKRKTKKKSNKTSNIFSQRFIKFAEKYHKSKWCRFVLWNWAAKKFN